MKHAIRCAFLALAALMLTGCFETFSMVNADYRPKGKTIAVVSGLNEGNNVVVADRMAAAFRKHTRLKVMSPKQVRSSLPGYPRKIKGPYLFAYFDIEADYGNTDMKKIRQIQQKLGVDYLYVIWQPTATVIDNSIEQYHCIAQLFAGPSSKEVGHGKFAAQAGNVSGCCIVPKPDDEDRSKAVDDISDYVAKEIGQKIGMLKATSAQ